jgi:hypothetical protein
MKNYEVLFDDFVEWNDSEVKGCLGGFHCQFLYLHDTRVIFSISLQHDINDILDILFDLYFTDMSYREYDSSVWIKRSSY